MSFNPGVPRQRDAREREGGREDGERTPCGAIRFAGVSREQSDPVLALSRAAGKGPSPPFRPFREGVEKY